MPHDPEVDLSDLTGDPEHQGVGLSFDPPLSGDLSDLLGTLPSFDPSLLLHKQDRAAVQAILREHLEKYMEYEENWSGRNPYSIDRDGLERALITYCAMVRRELAK